jgi:hypothetical protein
MRQGQLATSLLSVAHPTWTLTAYQGEIATFFIEFLIFVFGLESLSEFMVREV